MASKDTINQRLIFILDLLKSGKPDADIAKECSKKFKITSRQVWTYLKQIRNDEGLAVEAKKNVVHQVIEAARTENLGSLLTYAEKRSILARIARGEVSLTRVIDVEKVVDGEGNIKTKPITVQIPTSIRDRMFAINLDNAMTGDTAPDKHLVITQDLPFIFDVSTPAKPDNKADGKAAGGL